MIGKMIGILAFFAAVWAGSELLINGTSGAFGGAFATSSSTEEIVDKARATATTVQRAGNAVDRSYRETEKRYDEILDR